jgi:hypothetical protein
MRRGDCGRCDAFFVDPFAIVWNLHNLVYAREKPYLPHRNAWAPALYGHQFW